MHNGAFNIKNKENFIKILNNLDLDYFSIRLYLLLGLMVFYFFRSAFLIFMVYYKNSFLANFQNDRHHQVLLTYIQLGLCS